MPLSQKHDLVFSLQPWQNMRRGSEKKCCSWLATKGYSFHMDSIKLYYLCIKISSTKQLGDVSFWAFKVPWPVTSPSLIVDLGLIQRGCWFKLKTCLFKCRACVNKDLTACLLNHSNMGFSWLYKMFAKRKYRKDCS